MNDSRRFIWCILLKISIEDINRRISIYNLLRNADKTLINQVNCDVDRCDLPTVNDKLNLKRLVISVFSYRKEHYSYIQGIHEIGKVFLTLFYKYKKSNLSNIKKKLFKLVTSSDKFEVVILCKILLKKFNTEKGRMDICFKTFDRFLMFYSTPYVYKPDSIAQINLECILSKIVLDILCLLNRRSPTLYNLFTNLKAKDDRESKICMFILPWIITYFSHKISVKENKLIYYIFDHIISNHPLYIIFLVVEIIIQCETRLFDYIKQNFGSELTPNLIQNEIYPFVHFFFQNLDISNLKWKVIINNSHTYLTSTRLNLLNSCYLWEIEKKRKSNLRIDIPPIQKMKEMLIIYSMFIVLILSLLVSIYIGKFDFLKTIT
ncbi:TBC domain (small GTpase GAP) [Cryptosporidium sp. chipmunk genotype I]|uniref:TBC domain (small GTpase GAP) n=1 Tax=Cryptosporidium sp. chipmunk genotype I TaxID=1280935 RepID=UPI00351A96C4|nr:TBC domain (small GTpase GAP) [Cryptosporidium sp. chipmunk genotype I]